MKIVKSNSPYIRKNSSVKRMMIDVLIALVPVVAFSVLQFGFGALSVLGISIASMLICEFIFVFLTSQGEYSGKVAFKDKIKKAVNKATINNITAPLISAIIYAMIMPAGCKWYYVIIGAVSGMVFGKLLFGGLGANIFNPAALGRVITMICFASDVTYTEPAILGGFDVVASGTPLQALFSEGFAISWEAIKDLALGLVPGSMGEICKIAIIVGLIYLLIRKSADFRPVIGMVGSFSIIMIFAAIGLKENVLQYVLYQVLSGGLLFGAVFMVTDPVTSPVTRPGRITFGIIVGVASAFIRLLGAYPEGVAFAILIGNMIVPVIDYYKWSTNKYSYKHAILWSVIMILSCVVIYFAM